MSDSSPIDEPLLSGDQTVWVVITLAWLVIGSVALATGRRLFGLGGVLLGLASVYRIYSPN
jgi:hypothetical protein